MDKIKAKKRVLISVFDKMKILDLAKTLADLNWEIIATAGTAEILKKAGIKTIPIEKITGNPEAFDGRMKTISFQIESAILYDRQSPKHQKEAKKLGIRPIDMVICNLYPFEEITKEKNCSLDKAVDFIDIGGPTMLRAAAKNYKYVTVLLDPKDYQKLNKFLKSGKEIPQKIRLALAQRVFQKTGRYDKKISEYLKNVSRRFKI